MVPVWCLRESNLQVPRVPDIDPRTTGTAARIPCSMYVAVIRPWQATRQPEHSAARLIACTRDGNTAGIADRKIDGPGAQGVAPRIPN